MPSNEEVLLEAIFEQVSEINDLLRIFLNRSLSGKPRSKLDTTTTPTGIDKGKIIALRKAKWTFRDIAEEVGCSKTTAIRIVQAEEKKE